MIEIKPSTAYDEGLAAIGTQSPRDAAISRWRERKEAVSFERMCAVLKARKWALAHPERKRQIALKYALSPRGRAKQNAAARRRRALNPATHDCTCLECGRQWTRLARGPKPDFCNDACRQRYRYQERTPGARRIKRHAVYMQEAA
ncbi:MAG: hypothetical protein WC718_16360 [Phycisphaerales bacterium]|jgi:hypothetical protein